jgi:hypothetical protein
MASFHVERKSSMTILINESKVVEMTEKCLVAMFGFLHGSIHIFEVVTCDDNKLEMKFIRLRFLIKDCIGWFLQINIEL